VIEVAERGTEVLDMAVRQEKKRGQGAVEKRRFTCLETRGCAAEPRRPCQTSEGPCCLRGGEYPFLKTLHMYSELSAVIWCLAVGQQVLGAPMEWGNVALYGV
jgi:hypothetical protein